jgi:uncharacterized lipoprotein
MRMRWRWQVLALVALSIALSGCSVFRSMSRKACHEQQPYMKATTAPPLVIPAGLDPIDTTNALKLPTLKEPAPPARTGKAPCLDEPPPFKVKQPARAPQA